MPSRPGSDGTPAAPVEVPSAEPTAETTEPLLIPQGPPSGRHRARRSTGRAARCGPPEFRSLLAARSVPLRLSLPDARFQVAKREVEVILREHQPITLEPAKRLVATLGPNL